MSEYKDLLDKEEYKGLSYEETIKVLKENNRENKELKFHSPQKDITYSLDEPGSMGDLEEELSGP